MATKYQAKKVIKALSESGPVDDPNIQGYGISTAKAQGLEDEDGYVVVVYVADMKPVDTKKGKAPGKVQPPGEKDTKPPSDAASLETEPVKADSPAKAKVAKPPEQTASKKTPASEPTVSDYPDVVKTTSRSKDVDVKIAYVETGEFGFGY